MPPQALTLEDMRQRMLTRRNVDLSLNRIDLERAAEDRPPTASQPTLFVGRSLVMTNSPSHPSQGGPVDAADPHKLFQMLRKKKRATQATPVSATAAVSPEAGLSSPSAAVRHSPDRSEPHPMLEELATDAVPTPPPAPPTDVPPRPQAAHRPTAFANSASDGVRHAFSAGPPASKRGSRPRDNGTASGGESPVMNGAPNGRPATRQKLPSQSLDLFPASRPARATAAAAAAEQQDPFPKPQLRRATAPRDGQSTTNVNFNCLFVSGEGDLDGTHEEFPSPKTTVDIPLIETEWFSANDMWEALPGSSDDAGATDAGDDSKTLYELLVAQKGRRSAKR